MFEFLMDMGNYEDRKIARTEYSDDFFISTCRVSDGSHPFETAVCHPEYNYGKHVIVEFYDSEEDAEQGTDSAVSSS